MQVDADPVPAACSGSHRFGLKFVFQRRAPGAFHLGNVELNNFLAVALDPQTIRAHIAKECHRATGGGDNLFNVTERRLVETNDDARRRLAEEPGHYVVLAGDVDVGAEGLTIKRREAAFGERDRQTAV